MPHTRNPSRVLYESKRYVACVTRAGVSVQRRSNGEGLLIAPDHRQYDEWCNAWLDIIDKREGDALCAGFLRD